MKIETLNERQQRKLLQLCKEFLNKDITWHFWESDNEKYPTNQMVGYNKHAVLGKHKSVQPALEIHWYQLCLTELPKRICKKILYKEVNEKNFNIQCTITFPYTEGDYFDNLQANLISSIKNPVDFLWEFVEECKKNKYFK